MAIMATAVLALAGCGGGGDDDDGVVEAPEVNKPLSAQVDPVNTAIADQSCKEFLRLDLTSIRETGTTPGAPPTKAECDFVAESELLPTLKGIKFTKAVEYGTAGLMESRDTLPNTPAGTPTYSFWLLDADGQFRYVGLQAADPQFGKKPPADNNADENAQAFVESIKRGKCDPSLVNPRGGLAGQLGGPKKACEALDEGEIFAPAVKATPEPEVEKMGESLDFVFYGLATKRGYFTITMASGETLKGGGQSSDYTVYEELSNTIPRPVKQKGKS
jgi:hypothetical protein